MCVNWFRRGAECCARPRVVPSFLDLLPREPQQSLPWAAFRERYDFIDALHGCEQTFVYHQEGDVGVDTAMVCEAMRASESYQAAPESEQTLLFAAALLHDVAKPVCSQRGADGKVRTNGHSRVGALMARRILWEMDFPFAQREAVCGLIRAHQKPLFFLERPDTERLLIELADTTRLDHLAALAEADMLGRICDDQQELLERVALFRLAAEELGVLHAPWPFANDHSRFLYFRKPGRDPRYAAFDDTKSRVVLMSGLPGAGKDHWLRENLGELPVVSLDGIRDELDLAPTGPQGRVIQEARERARVYLRSGANFAWNATHLSRQVRDEVITLLADYNAHVELVYVEASAERLFEQNAQREEPVPVEVIERLLRRWEVPTRAEVHSLRVVINPY